MSEITAVVFDYGNVLSAAQDRGSIEAMARLLDLDYTRFHEVYWRFRVAYDEGALDPESYWRSVASAGDRTVEAGQLDQLRRLDIQSWIVPNPTMAKWAGQVREAGLKTAVLSNMPQDLAEFLMGPESWLPAFDELTFSWRLRCSKPDARIYRHCLERLGVTASEALFLDDREPNVDGAREAGMQALLFTDAASAAREMDGQFQLPKIY